MPTPCIFIAIINLEILLFCNNTIKNGFVNNQYMCCIPEPWIRSAFKEENQPYALLKRCFDDS